MVVGIGSAPAFSATPSGILLGVGGAFSIDVEDSSYVYINGKAGDGITFQRLN
jgi:hypothetical protein